MDSHMSESAGISPEFIEQHEKYIVQEDLPKIERSTIVDLNNVPADTPAGPSLASGALPTSNPVETGKHEFPALSDDQQQQLRLKFKSRSQLRELLLKGFIRWLVTVTLLSAMGGIMFYYWNRATPMAESDKQTYNFLVMGLSIALSLNLATSMKEMAVDARWWVLSRKERSLKEVDLILHLDSLSKVTKLAFVAPRLAPACFLWVFLCIATQIAIALISLNYSPDAADNMALLSTGPIAVANMPYIFTDGFNVTDNVSGDLGQQYLANIFGEMALSYQIDDSIDLPAPGTLWSANSTVIFTGYGSDGGTPDYLKYVFKDMNTDTGDSIFTNRTVNTTWSCESWQVIEGGNGSTYELLIDLGNNNGNQTIEIPFAGGLDQTTFITNPISHDCGPGCSTVHALEASNTSPWWYECNITVGVINNATLPEHTIGQTLAQMAAAGIALTGQNSTDDGSQYQSYPTVSMYGFPYDGDKDVAGFNIGTFAIGVIAVAATSNPPNYVIGDQPSTGSQLQVHWTNITIIFAVTAAAQLVLFILTSIVCNSVAVRDDSAIATARLLRPIVDRLGAGGTSACSKEICKLLDDSGHEKVVYSVKHSPEDNLHYLDLGHEKPHRTFPEGDYA